MRTSQWAIAAVVYNLFVILFGAWVRISGSGAGCGEHWPTCNGQIIPLAPSLKTIIEFTHRLTSGLSLIVTIALLILVFRRTAKGHLARKAAIANMVFILLEAAIGAGLVIFGLVDKNSSVSRAVVISLHLINTLGLVGCGICVVLWTRYSRPVLNIGKELAIAAGGALALAITSASGAITALGDTLFPVRATGETLAERLQRELTAPEHFLERLRVFHPVIALSAAALLVWLFVRALDGEAKLHRWAKTGLGVVSLQVLIGMGNIALSAPGWMQLVHLLLANVVWGAWVGTSITATTNESPTS